MKIGIVILNYNDADNTLKLLNHIIGFKIIDHIVVIDNNSTDNSLIRFERLRSHKKINIIKSEKNGGYAYGNNIGWKYLVRECRCDYVFIANPDVLFSQKFVIRIIKTFQKESDYAILSGIMLDRNNRVSEKPYWRAPSYVDDILDCTFIYRMWIKKSKYYSIDYSKQVMDVSVVPGSLFAISSKIAEEIGYFDENTFLYYEENILSKKIHNKASKAGIVTGINFQHLHGESVKRNLKVLRNHRLHLQSKYYYEAKYNKINMMQKLLLKALMSYSLVETAIILPFKRFFKN